MVMGEEDVRLHAKPDYSTMKLVARSSHPLVTLAPCSHSTPPWASFLLQPTQLHNRLLLGIEIVKTKIS